MKNLICIVFLLNSMPVLAQEQDITQPSNQTIQSNQPTQIQGTNLSNTGFLDVFYGAQGTTNTPTPNPAGENIFFTLVRVFFITGLLGFLTWVVLKYFFRKNAVVVSTAGNPIEILATIPAGLNVFFVLAKLHKQYYMFSLSSEGLRLLDKISDQETIDFLEINKDVTVPADSKFIDLIEKMPEGGSKKAMEFLRSKIDQLRKK